MVISTISVQQFTFTTTVTIDRLKKLSTSGSPPRPEARGIFHICHMVNPSPMVL